MSVLDKLAVSQGRRDTEPNKELAAELARTKDRNSIAELAENLRNKDKNIVSNCLKVLYEIGFIDPALIADYIDIFIDLAKGRNNRLIWGAMIAIAEVALMKPKEIWANVDDLIEIIDNGTVITVVWGVRALAKVASVNREYNKKLFPVLMNYIRKTIPRDVPLHAESSVCALTPENKKEFMALLQERQSELSKSQSAKLKKVLKQIG